MGFVGVRPVDPRDMNTHEEQTGASHRAPRLRTCTKAHTASLRRRITYGCKRGECQVCLRVCRLHQQALRWHMSGVSDRPLHHQAPRVWMPVEGPTQAHMG